MPDSEVGVGGPPDASLPLFAYGLLKRGELAHASVIGGELVRSQEAVLVGATLRYLDGLPLLDEVGEGGRVRGDLLWLDSGGVAYRRVGEFEPKRHYRWVTRRVLIGDDSESRPTCSQAEVLVRVRPVRTSSPGRAPRIQF